MKKYIIQKVVQAKTISSALKLEREVKPEAIWLKEEKVKDLSSAIGFSMESNEDEDE